MLIKFYPRSPLEIQLALATDEGVVTGSVVDPVGGRHSLGLLASEVIFHAHF